MNLKVLGSLDFVFTLQAHITKFSPKESKCVFLGYKVGMKGKKLLDINNREIFVSRYITNHEHIFPYQPVSPPSTWNHHTNIEYVTINELPTHIVQN